MTKKWMWFLFYMLVFAAELLIQALGMGDLDLYVKPLIIPVLTGLAISSGVLTTTKPKNAILLALLFAWCGDIFLMFQDIHDIFFIAGLTSFLLMHLVYTIIFLKTRNKNVLPGTREVLLFLLVALLFTTFLFVLIYPGLGSLKAPVIIYTATILAMAYVALTRKNVTPGPSFHWVFLGAIMFIISDSLLAVNKFGHPIIYSGVWIMLTYMTSQFMITTGLSRHE